MLENKKQEFAKPLIIAGPCSAESQEQLLATAKGLEDKATIFRAGVWKPRTRPNSFEGVGQKALEWLKLVKKETPLKVATEIANTQHVEACLKAVISQRGLITMRHRMRQIYFCNFRVSIAS